MGRGTAVRKSYVRGDLLSTENATELPKCSKSLHFAVFPRPQERFLDFVGQTPKSAVISRFFTGFAVRLANHVVSFAGFAGSLPDLWPLRCSLESNHMDPEKSG